MGQKDGKGGDRGKGGRGGGTTGQGLQTDRRGAVNGVFGVGPGRVSTGKGVAGVAGLKVLQLFLWDGNSTNN